MSIYIPKRLNVGFQNRQDTYTKKLAYVIYYDEAGKLRKETSWNGWRDKDIPNIEYDNIPTEGFVLNKKVGDYDNGWDHRKAYIRVYDPRGFEFEITVENLLWILECTTSDVGKGLIGEFIYGWDGKDLLLVPCTSPDYKKTIEFSDIINENKTIRVKDLKIGATYLDKNNVEYIYMGRFPRMIEVYYKAGKRFESEWKMKDWCKKNNIPYDKKIPGIWNDTYIWTEDKAVYEEFDKQHVFFYLEDGYWDGKKRPKFLWTKSLGKKFISCKDENCCDNYAELFDKLECTTPYSYIDKTKNEKVYFTLDEFRNIRLNLKGSLTFFTENEHYYEKTIDYDNVTKNEITIYNRSYCNKEYEIVEYGKFGEDKIEEVFELIKPYYIQRYLANNKPYDKLRAYEV